MLTRFDRAAKRWCSEIYTVTSGPGTAIKIRCNLNGCVTTVFQHLVSALLSRAYILGSLFLKLRLYTSNAIIILQKQSWRQASQLSRAWFYNRSYCSKCNIICTYYIFTLLIAFDVKWCPLTLCSNGWILSLSLLMCILGLASLYNTQ